MTRTQSVTILSAALLAALIGLALLLTLQALGVDEILAQAMAAAGRGQMRINDVMDVMASGGQAAQTYLSK
jgi:hypothetical protein